MRNSLIKMDLEFRLHWKHYVLQSLLATVAIFIVIYFLSTPAFQSVSITPVYGSIHTTRM